LKPKGTTQAKSNPRVNKELAQTYNYDDDRHINDADEKPVYDSSEGPIKKGAKTVQTKAKADVFISGDSFGGRYPTTKQANQKQPMKRETIGENFLEDEDDLSSGLAESGEIDPRLFKWQKLD